MRKTNFLQCPGILLLITLILSSILLTSCWVTGSLEMDLIVYRNDKYEMDLLLQIPSESILFIGGVEEFESALKDMLGGYSDNEENWVWEKYQSTNNSTYFYKIKSGRSDIVNGEFFDWKETKYNNRKAYLIEFIYAYELSELMSDYKLTLHADKILESNGTQIDNKTVTWINPNSIPYAVVIPKGSIQWFPLLLLFFIFLL